MKVYFIRHGQSECNRLDLRCGWSQTPLSELGRKQAKKANDYLKKVPFDKVYCSDLRRVRQTAAEALPGCELVYSDRIREIDVGDLSECPAEECQKKYGRAYDEAMRLQDFTVFGGESQKQMKERVRAFIWDLEKEKAEYVAVFGHEGTVHQMMEITLGQEILLEKLQIDNASVSVFEYLNGKWKLLQYNYEGEIIL